MARKGLAGARRRRRREALVLGAGLLLAGGAYTVLAPRPHAAAAAVTPAVLAAAQQDGATLYATHCASCHGVGLEGIPGRAPTLVGTGEADTYFQLTTGRMPDRREQLQPQRTKPAPEFDPHTATGRADIAALSAFVAAHGGGPALPKEQGAALIGPDPARGGLLFRLNCASCHNYTGRGGALTDEKFAPALRQATPEQMYAAMLSGPADMPKFGDRQLTPEAKKDVIAYILSVRGQNNAPGGFNLGEWGPVPEGIVALGVGLVLLVGITAWIGERA